MAAFLDRLIVILCLPFYAVAVPLVWLLERWQKRRQVHVGLEVTHWVRPDVRLDYQVVDLPDSETGLVGIRERRWDVRNSQGPARFGEAVRYVTVAEFWVPERIDWIGSWLPEAAESEPASTQRGASENWLLALPHLDLEAARAPIESLLGLPLVPREGLYHGGDYYTLKVPGLGNLSLEQNWDLLDHEPLVSEVPAHCALLFGSGTELVAKLEAGLEGWVRAKERGAGGEVPSQPQDG